MAELGYDARQILEYYYPGAGSPRSRRRTAAERDATAMSLSWADFAKVDMRVGVVIDAQEFPEARRPAFKLWIDFGPLGVKRSSAQITRALRRRRDLVGRRVVAVVNFPPKQIGPFVSEVLVLGAYDDAGQVILLRPDFDAPPGSKIG